MSAEPKITNVAFAFWRTPPMNTNFPDAFVNEEFPEPVVQKMWDDALETCKADGLSGEELDHMVHTLTARRLVEHLQIPGVSPGVLQCALRFLKDNDITALPVPGSAAKALEEAMKDRLPFKPRLAGTGTD